MMKLGTGVCVGGGRGGGGGGGAGQVEVRKQGLEAKPEVIRGMIENGRRQAE